MTAQNSSHSSIHVNAHRGDGKRFVVRADELLTAFLELERAVCVGLLIEQI
jgi:hypothetical protein